MLAALQAKLLAAALIAVIGASAGAIGMAKWDARTADRLRVDLAQAQHAEAAERAARVAIQQQCAAADAAASLGADLADQARRDIDRANQELDHATSDDDPLRAQLERLRGPGAAPRAGGDPAAPAGGADPLPRSP